MERSIGKCDWLCLDLICCVHLRQEKKAWLSLSLVCFESSSHIWSPACLQKVWFWTELQQLGLDRHSEHSGRGRGWEMRCAASSKWIWRPWLLYNKRTLWDLFYLLVSRRELCSWDIFLRNAMHSHHLWIVSKCCSESRWLWGSIKSWWMSLHIPLWTHLLEHRAERSIPAPAETSLPRGQGGLILRKKGGKPSLLPQPVGFGLYHQLMLPDLSMLLWKDPSQVSLCASVLRTWTGTGTSCVFSMEQLPTDGAISVSN